jgi:hypothetical protein
MHNRIFPGLPFSVSRSQVLQFFLNLVQLGNRDFDHTVRMIRRWLRHGAPRQRILKQQAGDRKGTQKRCTPSETDKHAVAPLNANRRTAEP